MVQSAQWDHQGHEGVRSSVARKKAGAKSRAKEEGALSVCESNAITLPFPDEAGPFTH